ETGVPKGVAAAAELVVSRLLADVGSRFDLTHLWAPAPASSPTAATSVGGARASLPCVATSPLPASRRPPPPEIARSATPTIPARGDKGAEGELSVRSPEVFVIFCSSHTDRPRPGGVEADTASSYISTHRYASH
ncbi:unnamed protein product, partial [Urochloa humidicola]